MNFKVLTLSDKEEWHKVLNRLPIEQNDIYYTPEYYSLYEELGDGKAFCFVFEKNGDIALYPFLKNSINELGYDLNSKYFDIQGAYGYNGVVSNCSNKNFIQDFYKEFKKYCIEKRIVAEFIRFHPLLSNYNFSDKSFNIVFDRQTIALSLNQGYSNIWENEYSSNNRNKIRKSKKLGYYSYVNLTPSFSEIEEFYNIYINTMKKVNAEKYYYFNNQFFYNIFKFIKKDAFIISIKNANHHKICSAIFIKYGKYLHYFLSGRDNKIDNSVNNLLLDEAIKLAIKIGIETFHLGGGRSNSKDDGLLKFKSNFSKTRFNFYIGKYIYDSNCYENILKQWENKYADKVEKYKNIFLKYRY